MSVRANREDLAQQILDAPEDHTIEMRLFDGETPVIALPRENDVSISISRELGFHASISPKDALLLGESLIWAAYQVAMTKDKKPVGTDDRKVGP